MSADKGFFAQFKAISKTVVTILSWVLFGILVLIIGFLVYYLIAANAYAVKGEKYEPKFSLYTIVSPSMEPKIKVYDVVVNTRIDNPHEKLTPRSSKMVIISHTKDGVALAKEYHLPEAIQEFIARHHGNSLTKYFYNEAIAQESADFHIECLIVDDNTPDGSMSIVEEVVCAYQGKGISFQIIHHSPILSLAML